EQQLDRGRLARAVGPEQAEDLAAVHLEVQGLERLDLRASPEVRIDLGEVPCLDNDVSTHHEGALCKTGRNAGRATPSGTSRTDRTGTGRADSGTRRGDDARRETNEIRTDQPTRRRSHGSRRIPDRVDVEAPAPAALGGKPMTGRAGVVRWHPGAAAPPG